MDLPSVLGGLAQGFTDFGKSVVDLFGTGGAAIGDLLQGTGTRNQDDFRKWLYNTNSVQDAAAKGLGTALNGVQTVSDYIPGIGAVTRNPLFNAAQGALGGLADEFKMNGENYDLGRAGQRAAVSGAAALAGSSLGDALKKSANPLLQSGLAQGLARGATGGAINQGGYAAIDGGDVWNSALQGAGMGALFGGATGLAQELKPTTYNRAPLTAEEKQLLIDNFQKQIDDIGPVSRFSDNPDDVLKRARVNELSGLIKAYQSGYDSVDDYNAAMQKATTGLVDNLAQPLEQTLSASENAINNATDMRPVLSKRLSGDSLDDAIALADTLKDVGANIDSNGYVTLYHRTSPDAAKSIYDTGEMLTKEPGKGLYWSTNRGADSSQGYGDSVVTAKIPLEKLQLDDIFDNNADVVLNTNGKNRLNVSEYLVNEKKPKVGNIDISGGGNNSEYFMSKYGDAITKAGADNSPEAMAALLAKRGNKDMIRDAFMTQQDNGNGTDIFQVYKEYDVGKNPDNRKLAIDSLTGSGNEPAPLIGYHGVATEKLKRAINDLNGTVVNPSLQIVDPEKNYGSSYGDVILLGNKDMYFNKGKYGVLDTWGDTNVYNRDIYSPRVPDYEERNGIKYIKGTKKEYTPENISDYMNKQGTKAVESSWASPGSLAATQAERFKNLSDIVRAAQEKLGGKDSTGTAFADFDEYVYDKIRDYADNKVRNILNTDADSFSDERALAFDNISNEVQNALNGKYSADDYTGLRTQEGQELLRDIRKEINNLPTDYFEAKVRRPVELKEFSGAILPEDYNDQEVINALKDAGVEVLGTYDRNNYDASLQDTLKSLVKGKNRYTTPYMLGLAGLLGGGAVINQALGDKDSDKDKKKTKRSA